MTRKLVSWVLAGAFFYAWWWAGHRWSYLNSAGNQWGGVYDALTLVSVVVLVRGARAAGGGLLDCLIGTVRGFLPVLPWLVLAIVVARAVAWLHVGVVNPADHFAHAVVVALVAGLTTSLWYGAIANADDS